MRRRSLGVLALALAAGASVYAQSITTGAIRGKVMDANGAPLAGARVILTSSQITRTIMTGADGSFRAGLLNPGMWRVSVSLSNFQTQTSRLNVGPNDNRTLNFKLAPVAAATVVVSAAAQVVDTTSVTTGENISMDQVAAIPKGRDFTSLAYFTPGVANGGFNANSPSMSGASAAENTYYVDGLDTTDYRYGFQGTQLKTNFIDQVSVQTGGYAPEYSALGGVFNAITKSGSNEFKGSSWVTWDAAGIHAALKQNKYFKESNLDADTRYDVGAEVSGPIIKDELFYFVGVDSESRKGISTTNGIGLQNAQPTDDTIQTVGKINWFINPNMQLTWFNQYNREKLDTGSNFTDPVNGPYGTEQAGYSQTNTTTSTNLTYDWTITPSLTLSVKGGFFQLDTKQNPLDTADNQSLDFHWYDATGPHYDPNLAGQSYNVGGFGTYTQDEKDKTTQFNADLTWLVGNHMFKVGGSYLKSSYFLAQIGSGTGPQYQISSDGTRLDAITFVNLPAEVTAYYKGLYLQDNWEMLPGFRVLYGFRYDAQSQNDYRGVQIFNFGALNQSFQPRLGLVWDVNNDGTTKVSASYARYFEHFPQRAAIRTWGRETYIDQVYNSGSTWVYDPTTPTHVRILGAPNAVQDYSTAFNQDPIAQGTRLPQRDEVTAGVDHQFGSGWTLGIHGTHRELKNIVEDSVILSNPITGNNTVNADGHAIWWNPGPSVTWTQTYVSPDAGKTYTVNNTGFPKAGNTYDSVDFTADRRTDRDYFSFNYTWSRLQGNYEGVVSSSNGQADGNITASFDCWAYVGTGLLPLDRTNQVKLQYSHRFTVNGNDMNLGYSYSYASGTPISLFDDGSTSQGQAPGTLGAGNAYDPLYYGNSTPANGELGQYGRTPAVQDVDMHMDYHISFGNKIRVIPSFDIFNLFNTRPATSIWQLATLQFSGAPDIRYGQESSWQEGRRYRFGVKVQF